MFFDRWRKHEFNKKPDPFAAINERLGQIEKRVQEWTETTKEGPRIPPIWIENAHIEQITVEKMDCSNNFGALGIKDLAGKLNIGANYSFPSSDMFEKMENGKDSGEKPPTPEVSATDGEGPRCNIRRRPDIR